MHSPLLPPHAAKVSHARGGLETQEATKYTCNIRVVFQYLTAILYRDCTLLSMFRETINLFTSAIISFTKS